MSPFPLDMELGSCNHDTYFLILQFRRVAKRSISEEKLNWFLIYWKILEETLYSVFTSNSQEILSFTRYVYSYQQYIIGDAVIPYGDR